MFTASIHKWHHASCMWPWLIGADFWKFLWLCSSLLSLALRPFLPSFLPSFLSLSPFSIYSYLFPRPRLRGLGEHLISPVGRDRARLPIDIWCILGQKIASGASSFRAVDEMIASVHKTKHFDGENCKMAADFYVCCLAQHNFTYGCSGPEALGVGSAVPTPWPSCASNGF